MDVVAIRWWKRKINFGTHKKKISLTSGAWSERKKAGCTSRDVAVHLGRRRQILAFRVEVWQKLPAVRALRVSARSAFGSGRARQLRLSPVFSKVSSYPMHAVNKHNLTLWK